MQTFIHDLKVMWVLELNMPLKWVKLICGYTRLFNVSSKSVKYSEFAEDYLYCITKLNRSK
jgi:hypothetical protein